MVLSHIICDLEKKPNSNVSKTKLVFFSPDRIEVVQDSKTSGPKKNQVESEKSKQKTG